MYPCVCVCTNACMYTRTCIRFSIGDAHAMHIGCFRFQRLAIVFWVCETFPIQCVQGHLQANMYARVVLLYNVFRCSSIGGTGISVNNVRGILSTKIPHKPTVTTTPKYRYSLNQVSNSRYRTGVKPKPWFKPQL